MATLLFMSDGSDIAVACARTVISRSADTLAVVIGPNVSCAESREIFACFDRHPPLIQTARPDLDPRIAAWAAAGEIDLVLSIFFEYRVQPSLLRAAKIGGINIHPSVLPNNGGFHTSFWGVVNKTPLGATLMWMDDGLDTGGVIARKAFADDGIMSANEIRSRQRQMCAELFEEHIDALMARRIPWKRGEACSYHFKKDIAAATTFGEDELMTMSQLMRLGRGTAHGNNGLTVHMNNGERFRLQIAVSRLPADHTANP